jgi:tRNA nucleotidyltransferase (CCA-adding enzyme)
MAKAADGRLIDPFHGQRDLQAKVLRHVGPAFAEDPVRILRIARFAARFSDFSVAPETLALMRSMVAPEKSIIWSPSASGRSWPRA